MGAEVRLADRGGERRASRWLKWRLYLASALSVTLAAGAAIVLADPASPVSISDVDTPDPVASGNQLTHTITIVNTGGAKISNVVLSDQLNGVGGIGVPPQLQLASSRGSCQQTGNLVNCNAGTIEGNGTWIVSIRGIVTAPNGAVLNNTVSITGTKSAQNFTTTNTVTTSVTSGGGVLPDLSINKTGPTTVPVNSPMTYTLTVNNGGTLNATDIKVMDTVPAALTITSVSGTNLFTCPAPYTNNTVVCTGGAVNQGSNATITINATTPVAVPAPATITNTAVVDPENLIPESNELNNTSALVNTLITPAQTTAPLSIDITDKDAEMTGAGPDPVMPGQLETFKMLVMNNAATRADDVVIVLGTQYLEAASILASQVVTNGAIGNTGGCVVNAPQAKCTVRSLNPGGTILMTVQGYVIGAGGAFMSSTATVTGNIKNQGVTSTDTELTTVMPQYDLTITKSDFPDPVCASSYPGPGYDPGPPGNEFPGGAVCQGGLTYTFVVGNSGIQDATGVVVRDPLPAGMIFDHVGLNEAGFACSYDALNNVVTCTGGAIARQSTKRLQFVTVAPAGIGQISNTVTVDPFNSIFEGDETNNTFTQATQVATGIDLTVVKHSNHEANFVATRGTLTYTVKVTNLGTQDATNILVRDILPADTLFRDAIADATHGFTCSYAAGIVDCSNGHIQGTKSMNYPSLVTKNVDVATITIRIFATPYEQAAMHNEVRVDPLGLIPEANENNNIAVQDTKVQHGGSTNDAFNELTISKDQTSPNKLNTARNAVVTYAIKVGNNGTDPVTGVKVRDTLPAGARYIQATGTNSFLCTQQSIGFVDCIGGQIAANTPTAAGATITIKAFAPDTPGTYTNQAEVDPDHVIAEGDEFNNTASVDTIVKNDGEGAFNDLTLMKTSSNTTPGGLIDYTIKVWNTGSDPASNVTVRDVLPAGTTYVSATDGGGPGGAFTCSEAGNVVTCINATINGNTNVATARIINIVAKAPNHNTTLHNQAIVDPDNTIPEGNELNNTSTADTQVQSVVNLKIEKHGPDSSNQSQPGQYVIEVTNEKSGAGAPVDNVHMHDPLPVGLIPLAVEIDPGNENNWACQITGNAINVVDCFGHLDAGQKVTFKIDVFMTAESGKSLDNEACVDPENIIEEFNPPGESDNCSTHTTVIVPTSPDLFVTKAANPGQVTPGQDLTYTVNIQNNGDASAASPLTLTDTLPHTGAATPSVDFTDASGTDGWTCTFSAPITVVCNDAAGVGLAPGAAANITIHVKVHSDVTLPLTNVASAAPALTSDAGAISEAAAGHTADNTASVTTSVGGSGFDLVMSGATDNPDPVAPGQPLQYTFVAVNGGTADAANVKIAIHLPSAGVIFQHGEGSNSFNCAAPSGNVLTCEGPLPAGGDTTIKVSMTVLLSLIPPADLAVTATIDPPYAGHPNGDFAESNEGNNSLTETTTVSGTTCLSCVDLVASQLLATPGFTGLGVTTQTFVAQVVNVGDVATTLNPATDKLVSLVVAAASGTFDVSSLTLSDPAFAPLCTTTTTPAVAPFTRVEVICKGNLGPSQGLTLTLTVGTVTGDLGARLFADPDNHITNATTPPEFREDNNLVFTSVVHF